VSLSPRMMPRRKGELIKQEHKQLFFYLAEVNEQAHRYLGVWRVSSTNVRQLFSAAPGRVRRFVIATD
jgi:hypothetical protein